jgi:murein peptide amidase A
MSIAASLLRISDPPRSKAQRSIAQTLAPLEALAGRSASLLSKPMSLCDRAGRPFELPRYLFIGPQGGDDPIRVGLFAGIHGDEPAGVCATIQLLTLLEQKPELARGYCLFVYPVCNPTGFEDHTRFSRGGHDLNREFWNHSREPEVLALQSELVMHAFDGVIALHTDDTSEGVYGYARGATITRHLLEPALAAAEEFLPRNRQSCIDGFSARDGIVRDCFQGVLSPPPKARPRPFEITFETPNAAPLVLQQAAMVTAVRTILEAYLPFIAYAAHL